MRLCHPIDMQFHRIGSGLILQATCCAPGCGRVYARLVHRKVKTVDAGRHFAAADDWASLLTMRRLFEEMRCRDTGFCESCHAGKALTACAGAQAPA